MKFRDAIDSATAHVYLIEWVPEDWPVSQLNPCETYVVAMSVGEAIDRLSTNPYDIKRISVLGDVIERPHG
jgi:hypothetical protein